MVLYNTSILFLFGPRGPSGVIPTQLPYQNFEYFSHEGDLFFDTIETFLN